jgi:hypothetical protein
MTPSEPPALKKRKWILPAAAGGLVVACLAGAVGFHLGSVAHSPSTAADERAAPVVPPTPNNVGGVVPQAALGDAGGTSAPDNKKGAAQEPQERASDRPNASDSALGYEDRGLTFFVPSTQLEWTKRPTKEEVEWGTARSYCESLELAGGKWRVPTYKELWRLLSDRVAGDSPSFSVPGLDSGEYWTSTPGEPYALGKESPKEPSMKTLDFTWGRDGTSQYMFPHYVRCVRGG